MPVQKLDIEEFLRLRESHPVIDVRSPGEYLHAHVPGAYNLPLFSDEERAIVGTTYKQKSSEQAIKIGLDFFGPKMKKMVEEVEAFVGSRGSKEKNKTTDMQFTTLPKESLRTDSRLIFLYCWRGGMRSAAVAWLLDLYGFKVYTLIGGYKKFRNDVLNTFKIPFRFKILGGYTGSGKTEVLKEIKKRGEQVVDLEEIAKHKGSAFGNIGMPKQPTQEMFENILATELRNISKAHPLGKRLEGAWIEDESQRIGLVNIPADLWKGMRSSPVYFIDIPFEKRLEHLVGEYGNLDREKMIGAIERISSRLGGLETKNAILHLREGNTTESFRILLKYYDKWYWKGLHNRDNLNSLLHTIPCESVNPLNAEKLTAQYQYHENP